MRNPLVIHSKEALLYKKLKKLFDQWIEVVVPERLFDILKYFAKNYFYDIKKKKKCAKIKVLCDILK